MVLTEQQIESYHRDGYLVAPAVFSADEIGQLRQLVYRSYLKFRPADAELDQAAEPWSEEVFDRKMLALRTEEPRAFGALYDCVQSSVEVLRFVTDPRVVSLAAQCLGDEPEDVSYSGIMLRMDPPRDERNAIDWHQDRAYYPQNEDGNHGLVATVALQDITAAGGALLICPGSHREGYVVPEEMAKQSYESSEQRKIPAALVEKYPEVAAEVGIGDVLFINMNLFHRSGKNTNQRIRFTALSRFHRIMAPDYVPFGLIYQFNTYLSDKVWTRDEPAAQ